MSMTYFALTQAAASWILGKAGLVDALHSALVQNTGSHSGTPGEEFVEGPFRIAWSEKNIIAMWNVDYLTGTGDESWGFIRVKGLLSLESNPEFSREVFERCIYIISQRLQGLNIQGTLFPRYYATGAHTCLAGRGSEARQYSVGYFETHIGDDALKQQAIVCVGPEKNWRILEDGGVSAGVDLPSLVRAANELIAPGRKVSVSGINALSEIRNYLSAFTRPESSRDDVDVVVTSSDIQEGAKRHAAGLSYDDWVRAGSSLSPVQRRILESDGIERHPLRVLGPGGSGKTLILQLLALRRIRTSVSRNEPIRVLYVVHNDAMAQTVKQRFDVLMADRLLEMQNESTIHVKTLSQIARETLELEDAYVIDVDAQEAKEFQFDCVREALRKSMERHPIVVEDSPLFKVARDEPRAFDIVSLLVMTDISIAIKGHGLERDKKRYIQSSRSLSRFHGIMDESERTFVFSVFEEYHRAVFEELEVLDSDDLAISLLGRYRTPIWELRRRELGYDYVFVDETQLFNENERRLIPLLTNKSKDFVPVVLALDEAQAIYGQSTAGFASLGIEGITNESLGSIHRSTKAIVDLAFFVIQRSTDLFGPDFPNFTEIAERLQPANHPLAAKPRIESMQDAEQAIGKFVLKRVRDLRKSNIRQVCVVVHAEQYWDSVVKEMRKADLPLQLLLTRGERLPQDQPLVVLTKPAFVGGQEFDAVIVVGLEQGLVPPRFVDNDALSAAVEQQTLREIYLSLTRARFQVIIAVAYRAAVTSIIAEAAKNGLVDVGRAAT